MLGFGGPVGFHVLVLLLVYLSYPRRRPRIFFALSLPAGALRFYKFFVPDTEWDVAKSCTSAARGTKVEYAPIEVAATASSGGVPSLAVAHADLEPHPDPATVSSLSFFDVRRTVGMRDACDFSSAPSVPSKTCSSE